MRGCVRLFVAADPPLCALFCAALQSLSSLCGARLLNGFKLEAFHWMHYAGQPIRGASAAVALETGAGWSGPVLMNC
ncbi:hypothetical protein PBY51_011425 [Eleginops maclovinus]|uniref:Uncharacterized protein n=1 Tax=Eleginops maclovinus TaxID=56733 RepID=A0AAN7XT22_ELEMC|nr:hypothetical protein PBY51_011425 [Eleginops maclovinus]